MKKVFLVAVLFACVKISAQSFAPLAIVVDANVGIEASSGNNHYQLKDISNGIQNGNVSIGAEVGILKWLGVGARFKYNDFFNSHDTSTNSTPKGNGYDAGLFLNFHPVHIDHFDLPIGFTYGFTHVNYNLNDANDTRLVGQGSWGDFHINPRIYIGKFGINANLSFPVVNYTSVSSNNNEAGNYINGDWHFTGISVSVGVQVRIFNGL